MSVSSRVDVWSLGIIVIELLIKKYIWQHLPVEKLCNKLMTWLSNGEEDGWKMLRTELNITQVRYNLNAHLKVKNKVTELFQQS